MKPLDLKKAAPRLDELVAIDEKLVDRGPIKVLPRPPGEAPDAPVLKARMAELLLLLQVKRNYAAAKGHDLDGNGNARITDLDAVGTLEEIKTLLRKGQDRALPNATTIVRVGFPNGEHLWFDPADLLFVKPPKKQP